MAFGESKYWENNEHISKADAVVQEMKDIKNGVNELIAAYGGEILSSIATMDDNDIAGFKKMLEVSDTSIRWFDHFTQLVAGMDKKLDGITERLDSIEKDVESIKRVKQS